jgi:2-polyprenyl-3-methyl-5-hydroxy-6-metoxy-1,4-benzoquinol methylase
MYMKCYLCGSEQQHIFARVESFGFPLVYYQCEGCGLIFQSLAESQAVDPTFYEETYRQIYQQSEAPTAKDLWVQQQRADYLLGFLRSQNRANPQRILDIGASAGVLLQTIQKEIGCEAVGVEPGIAYRAHAEQRGLRMFPSIEELIDGMPERFDLVSMLHVLEHLPDPIGTLTIIRKRLLSEKGALLVEVPNFYSHDCYELAHLTCFTPHTLHEMLYKSGFKLVSMERHGFPRSKLFHLYLTCLATPDAKQASIRPVQPEKFVNIKRKLGLVYRRILQKLLPNQAWLPLPSERKA